MHTANETNSTFNPSTTKPEHKKYGWYNALLSIIRLIALRIKQLIALTYLCTIGLIFSIILSKRWSKEFNQWAENILSGEKQVLNPGQTNDLANAEGAIRDLEKQVKSLQTELSQKDAEIEELKAEKSTLEEKIKKLEEANNKALNAKVAELEETHKKVLNAKIAELEEAKTKYAEQVSAEEVQVLVKQINDLKTQLSKPHEGNKQLESLKNELRDTKNMREKLEIDVKNLREELDEKKTNAQKLAEVHNKAQEEVGRLTEELKGANQALTTFFNLCAKQVEQLENLQTENKWLPEKNAELNSTLENLKINYQELAKIIEAKGEDFSTKLKEQSTRISELNGKVILCGLSFAKQLDEKNKELEKIKEKAEEKDTQIEGLRTLNKTLKEEKKNAQEALAAQKKAEEAEAKAHKVAIETKEESIRNLEKQLNAKNSAQQQTLAGKDREIAELEERLRESEEKSSAMIQSLTNNNENISSKLEEVKKEAETKKGEHERTISEKDRRIAELEERLRKSQEESNEQSATIQSLTDNNKNINDTVKQENLRLQTRGKELEEQVKSLQTEKNTLEQQKEQELEEVQRKNGELTKQLQAEKKNVENQTIVSEGLHNEFNELTQKYNQLDGNFENLKQQLDDQSREFAAEKEKVVELGNTNQVLEKNLMQLRDAHEQWMDREQGLKFQLGELGQQKLQIQQELEEKIKLLQAQTNELKEDNTRKEQELTQTHQSALQAKEQELSQANSDFETQKSQLEKIHSTALQEKEQELSQAKSDFETQKSQLQAVKLALENAETTHTEQLEKQRKKHEENISELRGKLTDLESQLSTKTKEKEKLGQQISELQEKVIDLEAHKVSVQKTLEDVTSTKGVKLAESQKEVERLTQALDNQQKERDADSRQKAGEIENLRKLKEKANQTLADQKTLIEQLQDDLTKIKASKKQEDARLAGQLKTGKATVESLQEEERKLKESIKALEEKQQKLQNEAQKPQQTQDIASMESSLPTVQPNISEYSKNPEKQKDDTVSMISSGFLTSTASGHSRRDPGKIFHSIKAVTDTVGITDSHNKEGKTSGPNPFLSQTTTSRKTSVASVRKNNGGGLLGKLNTVGGMYNGRYNS